MSRNKIAFVIVLIPAFLFLQGCLENTLPPDIVNQLQAPRLLYPPDDTTDVDIPVTFSWEGSRNIKDYFLQVSIDSLFDSLVYTYHGRTTIVRDVMGLNYQTNYYWRVNAINGYGETKWSTVWNFTTGKFCNGTPIVEYFGEIYKTVQIGEQCWLRENLDVGAMINGSYEQRDNGVIEKYCYNDSIENCYKYGGLYQWNEAMQYSNIEGTQGICPPGWHLPTLTEFQACSTAVNGDGNALKAVGQGDGNVGGGGTNTSGFSALLAGCRSYQLYFHSLGSYAYILSSSEHDSTHAYSLFLHNILSGINFYYFTKEPGFSIRCLKD